MQLEIYTPADGQTLPPVEWNFADLKEWLGDGLSKYKGRVYDESQIKDAKKDAADLRKLAAAIDGKRKEMKSRYLEPYTEFEAQAKELTGMIDDQVSEITAQITAFDEARKAEKLEHIKFQYGEIMGGLAALVPYEKIHEKRWLNVTVAMTTICTEIAEKAESIQAALASIDALGLPGDMTERVKSVYLKNLDLAAALAEKACIEREQQAMKEYQAAQEKAVEAAQTGPRVYDVATDPDALKKAQPGDVVRFGGPQCKVPHEALGYATDEVPDLLTVDFRIHATREQLAALKAFLIESKIKYGPVPHKN